MTTETPEVSVVIPTRNRASLLEKTALRAALAQEGVAIEVIVVDDASTDETPRLLQAFADDRVKHIRHDVRRNQFRARNTGIEHARGTWIAFLDDDDVWSPGKLRAQIRAAAAEDATVVYTGAIVIDEHARVTGVVETPPADGLARRLLARNWLRAGSSTVIARADLLAKVGGFDESLTELADWDLWIRLALTGRVAACREPLAGYLAHPGNRRVVGESDVYGEFEYLTQKHREARERHGVRLDRVIFARWVAEGHRRAGRRAEATRVYLTSGIAERHPGMVLRGLAAPLGSAVDALYDAASARFRTTGRLPEPAWLALYRSSAPLT